LLSGWCPSNSVRGRRSGCRRADAGAAAPDLDGGDGGRLARPLSAVERGAALPGDRVNAAGVKDVVSRSLYFGAWADKEVNASSLN
jgi:hypothetical protein